MRRVHGLIAVLVVAGGLAALPAAAGAATVTVSPTSLTFAAQQVGSTSVPQDVTLTKDCTGANQTQCLGPPAEGPTFAPVISVTGPFTQTNNCPPALTASALPDPGTKTSCTIKVRFKPTAKGPATGTLSTGSGGPTVTLTGTGKPKKKCKKKKSGASAAKKKCKKKK